MAAIKKKKKVTLVSEPKWEKLVKAKTEEAKVDAFKSCESFVHYEVGNADQIKALKKWLTKHSGWVGISESVAEIPDAHLYPFAKVGWKAIKLGFMPELYKAQLKENIIPLLKRSAELKEDQEVDPLIHPDVSNVDKDHFLHPNKVKAWIKIWKSWLRENKKFADSKESEERMQYQIATNYVYNLNLYLRTSIYADSRYGEKREHKIGTRCYAIAYDEDGMAKRNVGTWYPDVGLWTKEKQCNWTD